MANNITYPQLGSRGNWGSDLNNNFRLLEQRMNRIYQQVANTQNLIGIGVPYVYVDNEQFFVDIVNTDGSEYIGDDKNRGWKLVYYPKRHITEENTQPTATYYQDPENLDNGWDAIPLFLGAYILEDVKVTDSAFVGLKSNDGSSGANFKRGDYIVRISEFGSLYSENYTSTSFKQYPIQTEGYVPCLASEPYHLVYGKVNSVDWFAQMTQENGAGTKQYTLPSIGYQSFQMYEIAKKEGNSEYTVNFSFRVPEGINFEGIETHIKNNIWPQVQVFQKERDKYFPIEIAYAITEPAGFDDTNTGDQVTYTISFEQNELPNDGRIYISIGHRIGMQYPQNTTYPAQVTIYQCEE